MSTRHILFNLPLVKSGTLTNQGLDQHDHRRYIKESTEKCFCPIGSTPTSHASHVRFVGLSTLAHPDKTAKFLMKIGQAWRLALAHSQ